MNPQAQEAVKLPAIGLIATAGIGIATQLLSLGVNILGVGASQVQGLGDDAAMMNMMSGGVGIVSSIIGLVVGAFIIFAALQMMKLEKHSLSFIAAIVAAIPCISPCCCIGLPIGIWAAMTLNKPEIKSAFSS